ncbi:hypothetical protein [Opitutus terrae]|uniref:hypothetical protein n=1 Tax=Opitutus terrae TaxID=107709 RepID=UPI0005D10779|nr:hypothetical protein [Opitutus terrae]
MADLWSLGKMDRLTLLRLNFAELSELLDMTRSEIASFNDLAAREKDTDFLRRLKVRVVFSCIEAHVFHLKSAACALSEPGDFSDADKLELQDLRLAQAGFQKAKRPLKENIKLAFRAYGRVCGKSYKVDFSGEEGARFLAAVEIRDRVTHPKSPRDWRVSASDHRLVDDAWHWFGKHLVAVSSLDE